MNYEKLELASKVFFKMSQTIEQSDPVYLALSDAGLIGDEIRNNQTYVNTWNEILEKGKIAEKLEAGKKLEFFVGFSIVNNKIAIKVNPADQLVQGIVQKNFMPILTEILKKTGDVATFQLNNWFALSYEM